MHKDICSVDSVDNDSYPYLFSSFVFLLSSSTRLGFEFGEDLVGYSNGLVISLNQWVTMKMKKKTLNLLVSFKEYHHEGNNKWHTCKKM